jgi:hypothetical protein
MATTAEKVRDLERQRYELHEQYEDGTISLSELEQRVWGLDAQIETLQPTLPKTASIDIELMRPEA